MASQPQAKGGGENSRVRAKAKAKVPKGKGRRGVGGGGGGGRLRLVKRTRGGLGIIRVLHIITLCSAYKGFVFYNKPFVKYRKQTKENYDK